jgi:hypothetical protein
MQAFTWGTASPGGTALRAPVHETKGNLVVVPIDGSGAIAVQNARGTVRIRVEVYGYLE